MDYCVAVDDAQKTSSVWLKGVRGIPYAYVVDEKGIIAWKGHPLDGLDTVVEKVLAGTYDKAARRAVAKQKELQDKIQASLRSGDFSGAEEACLALLKSNPGAKDMESLLFRIYDHNKWDLKKLYPKLEKAFAEKPEPLARLAMMIVSRENLKERDPAFALKTLKSAKKLAKKPNSMLLRAEARVLYALGVIREAVKAARKAVKAAADEEEKKLAQTEADYYAAAQAAGMNR